MNMAGSSSGPAARRRLGVINTIRRDGCDKSLQCACHLGHGASRKQIIDLSKCESRLQLEKLLLEWLVAGVDVTGDQHKEQGRELRKSLGIKIRS